MKKIPRHIKKKAGPRKKQLKKKKKIEKREESESPCGSEESSKEWFEGEDDSTSKAYSRGQYYRVHLGDELSNNRYIVETRLGWGHFSTVWLATDRKTNSLVALKIQKSAPHYKDTALDEIELLSCCEKNLIEDEDLYVVRLIDDFRIYNHDGACHVVMVFEVMGENLLNWIERYEYRGIPLAMAKKIAKEILYGLDFLHSQCDIIHTDLKPENVLMTRVEPFNMRDIQLQKQHAQQARRLREISRLESRIPKLKKNPRKRMKAKISKLRKKCEEFEWKKIPVPEKHEFEVPPPMFPWLARDETGAPPAEPVEPPPDFKEPKAKIVDLGNACWTHKHFTTDITTRQYRAIESLVGADYDTSVDIWSLACMIFELVTGEYLFNPKEQSGGKYTRDEDHVALIVELLGKIPKPLLKRSDHKTRYFNAKGDLKNITKLEYWPLLDVCRTKYHMPDEEAELFCSFMLPMLEIQPEKRATAKEMLKHPWLTITEEDKRDCCRQERRWYFRKIGMPDPLLAKAHSSLSTDEEVENEDPEEDVAPDVHPDLVPAEKKHEIARNFVRLFDKVEAENDVSSLIELGTSQHKV